MDAQLKFDNHDLALDEKLEIITTCFDKQIHSVIIQLPDVEELFAFKMCVKKFARVKMRSIAYYHKELHKQDANESNYFLKNLSLMKPFMTKF